jgi:hypothetical protein
MVELTMVWLLVGAVVLLGALSGHLYSLLE